MPSTLALIVTRRCNLSCVYCPVGKRDEDLSPDDARQAIRTHRPDRIRLTGGEPTLAWGTIQAVLGEVQRLADAGHHTTVELCTNGLNLDPDRIHQLADAGVRLVVSVDGSPRTQRASGRRPIEHLDLLLAQPQTCVTQTITPAGARSLLDDFLVLWELGARYFNLLPVYYRPWSSGACRELEEGLEAIGEFGAPRVQRGEVRFRNLERSGALPLFNDAPTVDTDGRLYRTNLILSDELCGPLAGELAGDDHTTPPLPAELRQRHEAQLTPAVRRSNARLDAALQRLVTQLTHPTPPSFAAGPDDDRPNRLEFHIAYECDNHCTFCSEADRLASWRRHPVTAREIRRTLLSHARAGGDHVNFTGGEPTQHPAFHYALDRASSLGLRTYVGTNGSALADTAFADRAMPRIHELSLSIHGSRADLHDALTGRPGSFDDLLASRANALRHPHLAVFANAVVTTCNVEDARAVIELCAQREIPRLLLSNVAPEGRALVRYEELAVPLAVWKELAPELVAAADRAGVAVRFFGLPYCALGEARMRSNDLYYDPRATVERARGAHGSVRLSHVVTRHPRRGRRKTRRCHGCRYGRLCGGAFGAYLDRFGDAELEAVLG